MCRGAGSTTPYTMALAKHTPRAQTGRTFDGILETASYRSYWTADSDSETLMASGTNGRVLLVERKSGLVTAKTSSQADRTSWPKIRLTIRAFREFARLLADGKDKQAWRNMACEAGAFLRRLLWCCDDNGRTSV